VLACVALAALSLLLAGQPTYDPTAWLIWGREITHGTLDTVAGPSWKPLPVLVTTPAALLGDGPAPLIWLAVARAGGFLAIWLAYAVASRLAGGRTAGRVAGWVAAVALVLANTYLSGVVRGNSEGLLVAFVLAAVLAELEGRPRLAFGLGTGAALLRPEAWPLLALHGLWLLRTDGRRRTLVLWIGLAAVAVLALWFVPEKLGSGSFLRGASRAREPVANSPAQAAFPFGAVFTNGASALVYPVYAGAVWAVVDAVLRRRTAVLMVAALATAWMLIVAALAQAGFTGNLRYVTLPAALLCVLSGVGWAAAGRLQRARWVVAVLALACVPGVVQAVSEFVDGANNLAADERLFDDLPRIIALGGGEAAVKACGPVYTGPFQTQALAWRLHVHEEQIGIHPAPPGTVLARAVLPMARDARFPQRERTRYWVLRQTCR
jgi:hypothetical protein